MTIGLLMLYACSIQREVGEAFIAMLKVTIGAIGLGARIRDTQGHRQRGEKSETEG